ncbi:DNA-binding response regulator, NarL/FixJ family, contains REC and HTH domains [Parafrankia irregularis]|uniref:DNA-binding response regulator, NarL/FixJ family, contains REC and HTH domains n=1 Tax=Parafrankia irregularis TaxID=795642 RepID=A0A0S4QYP8_9ACTN|nr:MULTISPECIES: adenylate/guanylate cyclase domain-containing protein [Parafrankia]MBE3203407.1 response regulator [Parafrankia sp. CH37]CUU60271.1 DNA-binding response regulator, NarL/FixJ family, contains REC and HTH domains [Parafrankia irregularis]
MARNRRAGDSTTSHTTNDHTTGNDHTGRDHTTGRDHPARGDGPGAGDRTATAATAATAAAGATTPTDITTANGDTKNIDTVRTTRITVLLADDNLIVREGVRALLSQVADISVIGVAADHDELVRAAGRLRPEVVVTDIRMPPDFTDEGVRAAQLIRAANPATGIVLLSQYDEPDYAIALLRDGASGYAYLLKERVADPDLLARAIREVATGGSLLDPDIVAAVMTPVRESGTLSPEQEELLRDVAHGRPVAAIAARHGDTPAAVNAAIDTLLLRLAQGASAGQAGALRRLRMLHEALMKREEQDAELARLLPSGLAAKLRDDATAASRAERLDVTVLMSDIRGYSGIAQRTDPMVLAHQLDEHRREMNAAILEQGGSVLQYAGDAVVAVFGAPNPTSDHRERAVHAAQAMHRRQDALNEQWARRGSLEPFGLGVGVSTGEVAAALLGCDARREYTLVGDTMNLAARLQTMAEAGATILSAATAAVLPADLVVPLDPRPVKGRVGDVFAFRVHPAWPTPPAGVASATASVSAPVPVPVAVPVSAPVSVPVSVPISVPVSVPTQAPAIGARRDATGPGASRAASGKAPRRRRRLLRPAA